MKKFASLQAVLLSLVMLMFSLNGAAMLVAWRYRQDYYSSMSQNDITTQSTITDCDGPSETSTPISSSSSTQRRKTLIVTGTVRDVAEHLPRLLSVINHATEELFAVLQLVFFENDSADQTVEVLQQSWNQTPSPFAGRVHLLQPHHNNNNNNNNTEKRIGPWNSNSRTGRLAHARNEILSYVARLLQADYVLQLDMDGVNFHLTGLETCLQLPSQDWSACCVNNYGAYYDLWALRTHDNWTDCDVFWNCNDCPKRNKKCAAAIMLGLQQRRRHLPVSLEPFEVKSCFGGAALYKLDALREIAASRPYQGTAPWKRGTTREQCEHVSFNLRLPGKIYIQPKFLNCGYPSINTGEYPAWSDSATRHFYAVFNREPCPPD